MKNFKHSRLHTIYILLLFSFLTTSLEGQCPPGDIVLLTQQEVDDFGTSYLGCSILTGSLVIGPSSTINNLNALTVITEIGGRLDIRENDNLTDISGLSNLVNVGNSSQGIVIIGNSILSSIDAGFASLASLTGGIEIKLNPMLTDFDLSALSAPNVNSLIVRENAVLTSALLPTDVTSISGELTYFQNPLLNQISNMDNLISVNSLTLRDILANTLPPFNNLTTIGPTGLAIESNANISQIPTFPSLSTISGTISIQLNPKLVDFDLTAVATNNISLIFIRSNDLLTSALLPLDLTNVSGFLQIDSNPILSQLSNMDNLVSVGRLAIQHTLVTTLPSFSNLTTIGQNGLFIDSNANISQIPTFTSLSSIGDVISIQLNPKLTDFDLSHIGTNNINNIYVRDNNILTAGLLPTDITNISGDFLIQRNPLLEFISDMDQLQSIMGDFQLNDLIACKLPDFPALTFARTLTLENNSNLIALPRFASNTIISDILSIQNNPNLIHCSVEAICNYLAGTNTRFILGNLGACFDETNVNSACAQNLLYPEVEEICSGNKIPTIGFWGGLILFLCLSSTIIGTMLLQIKYSH